LTNSVQASSSLFPLQHISVSLFVRYTVVAIERKECLRSASSQHACISAICDLFTRVVTACHTSSSCLTQATSEGSFDSDTTPDLCGETDSPSPTSRGFLKATKDRTSWVRQQQRERLDRPSSVGLTRQYAFIQPFRAYQALFQ
jgi:hypothetical protein